MNSTEDQRLAALRHWLEIVLNNAVVSLVPLAGDASFRRYFRVYLDHQTWVVMDAPPAHEDSRPFVNIAKAFTASGVCVPDIVELDLKQGFLLLTDFGDDLYVDQLTSQTAGQLYHHALLALSKIQTCQQPKTWQFPPFDYALQLNELNRFVEWYLKKYLNIMPSARDEKKLQGLFDLVIKHVLDQPQVCVHRDYHSRNLMVVQKNIIGVLDFQDAVWGPITYDLVSLLRDAYIDWPSEQVEKWVSNFYYLLVQDKRLKGISLEQFIEWFDWAGVQRHVKVIGIFARLYKRDDKPIYLNYIPRVLTYLKKTGEKYSELKPLMGFLDLNKKYFL